MYNFVESKSWTEKIFLLVWNLKFATVELFKNQEESSLSTDQKCNDFSNIVVDLKKRNLIAVVNKYVD